MFTTLTPAYGRDYKSVKALKEDIKANKDFIINDISSPWDGKACSPTDFKGEQVQFRYNKLQRVVVIKC